MDTLTLRPGLPSEASTLSELAMRSKGFWGYDEDFLTACREDLTVLPSECDGRRLVVAVVGGIVVGYIRVGGTQGSVTSSIDTGVTDMTGMS